jgi:Zn-dependent peptidase ImmA (M78 family)
MSVQFIKISGIQYELKYKSTEEMSGHIGLADFNNQIISINREHTSQTQHIALWHEILHILSDSYNLKLDEETVKFTTHALIALLSDNPELAKELIRCPTVL